MAALLDDAAGVQDDDTVGVADGRETVSDDQRGSVAQKPVQGRLYQHLGVGVDVRGGLVEDQDTRVAARC